MGQYALAKDDYLKILEQSQGNVLALKGLAESCFKLGKQHAKAQLLARARDDFQEAADSVTKAIVQRNDFLCNWKVLGDVCYSVAILPEKYCYLDVVPGLVQLNSQCNEMIDEVTNEKVTRLIPREIFLLAIR